MELSIGQKELIFNWMKTKPYYQTVISKLGAEGAVSWYVKRKHPKSLKFILLALETRSGGLKRNVRAERHRGIGDYARRGYKRDVRW